MDLNLAQKDNDQVVSNHYFRHLSRQGRLAAPMHLLLILDVVQLVLQLEMQVRHHHLLDPQALGIAFYIVDISPQEKYE